MSVVATGGSQAELTTRYTHAVMNTFGPPKRVFVRGEGVSLWDADGNRYLDLLAGLAVNALGHAHPQVLGAISAQLSTLGHVSNFFATPTQIALAERLAGFATVNAPGTPARVFFTNSGTEANEAGFKITRRTGRTKLVAMEGAFHGRSLGALALTANPAYREPFEPLPGEVVFVPYGDADALAAVLDETVAAVIVEPIQGENGVVEPPSDFLMRVRELTTAVGALLWIDEVQTGLGRCGAWLASSASGVTPDIVTFAKGLGNGFPVGACVATGAAASLLGPGSHGTTFGGNPVAAAAGLAVIGIIERDGLLDRVVAAGERLASGILGLDHPQVTAVRGRGLLRGVVLADPIAAAVAEAALDAGFVINAPRPNVLRLAPPLIISDADIDRFVAALPGLLDAAAPSTTPSGAYAPADSVAGGSPPSGSVAGGSPPSGSVAGGSAPADSVAGGSPPSGSVAGGSAPADSVAGGSAPSGSVAGGSPPVHPAASATSAAASAPQGSAPTQHGSATSGPEPITPDATPAPTTSTTTADASPAPAGGQP